MSAWASGVWNFVFVGCKGAPDTNCGNDNYHKIPATNVTSTPDIAEKPYLVMEENGTFKLMKPRVEKNKVGNTESWDNADEIDFSKVYVAKSTDSADLINSKLIEGLNIVFQPGIYTIDKPLTISWPNTVVLGIGMATLISASGNMII